MDRTNHLYSVVICPPSQIVSVYTNRSAIFPNILQVRIINEFMSVRCEHMCRRGVQSQQTELSRRPKGVQKTLFSKALRAKLPFYKRVYIWNLKVHGSRCHFLSSEMWREMRFKAHSTSQIVRAQRTSEGPTQSEPWQRTLANSECSPVIHLD